MEMIKVLDLAKVFVGGINIAAFFLIYSSIYSKNSYWIEKDIRVVLLLVFIFLFFSMPAFILVFDNVKKVVKERKILYCPGCGYKLKGECVRCLWKSRIAKH